MVVSDPRRPGRRHRGACQPQRRAPPAGWIRLEDLAACLPCRSRPTSDTQRERMPTALPMVETVVRTMARTAVDNEKYFGDLDSVVGDGDFGYSLARGFEMVLEELDGSTAPTSAPSSRRSGSSSPAAAAAPRARSGAPASCAPARPPAPDRARPRGQVVAMLRAAIEGIKERGGADARRQDAARRARPADRRDRGGAGGRAPAPRRRSRPRRRPPTRGQAEPPPVIANRGRASYTGERSIGTPRRRAPSRSRVMFEALPSVGAAPGAAEWPS